MYQFIESIRIENGEISLLNLHQDRVNQTFTHFGNSCKINLKNVVKGLNFQEAGIFKLRIVYNLGGGFSAEISPYFFPEIENFTLVENNFGDYPFKFTDRKFLDEMKNSAATDEIIIVKNGQITDTTFSNLIFLKDGEWFTPKSFLLNGIQRRNLLQNKLITEAEISINNLGLFTHFQMINAMNSMDANRTFPIEKIVNSQQI